MCRIVLILHTTNHGKIQRLHSFLFQQLNTFKSTRSIKMEAGLREGSFGNEAVAVVLHSFRNFVNNRELVTASEFLFFTTAFASSGGRTTQLFSQIFEEFADECNTADYQKLACVLAVFSAGTNLERIEELCSAYTDNTSRISLRNATLLISSIFTVYFLLDASLQVKIGCSAYELAYELLLSHLKTTNNPAGILTVTEVAKCFEHGIHLLTSDVPHLHTHADDGLFDGRLLFRSIFFKSSGDLVATLLSLIDEEGVITFSSYIFAFDKFLKRSMRQLAVKDQIALDRIVRKLFEEFDVASIDAALCEDIVCGLLLLTGGSPEDKAVLITDMFRQTHASFSIYGLEACIEAILTIVTAFDPGFLVSATLEDVLARVMQHICDAIQLPEDVDEIAPEVFQYWLAFIYSHFGRFDASHEEDTEGEDMDEEEEEEDSFVYEDDDAEAESSPLASLDQAGVMADLVVARHLLHLTFISASEVVEIFSEKAVEGALHLDEFLRLFDLLCRLDGCDDTLDRDVGEELALRIFRVFEEEEDVVDAQALCCGLMVLADSTAAEKVLTAFSLLREEGSSLHFAHLERMFTCCLRVMACCSDSVAVALGDTATLEREAQDAVVSCFEQLQLSTAEPISLTQLKHITDRCLALFQAY